MSVIAWDGKMVAADKQATLGTLRVMTTKIRRIASGEILGWTGDQDSGMIVAKWYEDGADPEKWPVSQKDKDDWSRLLVFSSKNPPKFYERQPVAVTVEDKFMAWGCGRDFAIGAMALGSNAIDAVLIASRFDSACGMGVDSFSTVDSPCL